MKTTRSQIINAFIERYGYKSYLEIGVNTPAQPGWNFDSVEIETKHGVDPAPDVNATFKMTSDEFFANHIKMSYDIVFVDGLHLSEQAYKDIKNSLDHLSPGGTIVIHDCNPKREITQRREKVVAAWHGDVWKAFLRLRIEEPNLTMYTIDTDEGCGIVRKGFQTTFTPPIGEDVESFSFFAKHRKEILNLVSPKQFFNEILPSEQQESPEPWVVSRRLLSLFKFNIRRT